MTSVLSLLQDPRGQGGTATVGSWYRAWMRCNRPAEGVEFVLDDQRSGWPRVTPPIDGEVLLARFLPPTHLGPLLAGRHALRHEVLRHPEAHVVGASALHGHAADRRVPYLVWFATTITDERRAVISLRRGARRLLHAATLPALDRLEHQVLMGADQVLAMSRHTADVVVASGVRAGRVEVLGVPVDTRRFRPGEGERQGLLFVGRVHDLRKGFDRVLALLRTSAEAREAGVDVVSPGSRPRWPTDLAGHLRWHGRVARLEERYRSARALLLPSRQEGLGIVALEAMACATPVIAWACGGPEETVERSRGGVVVRDANDLRRAVEVLLRDPTAGRDLGHAGRRHVLEHADATRFLADPCLFRVEEYR